MTRRILGIPIAIIAVLAIGALAGGAWLFTQDVPSNISIVGEDLSLWANANMTAPLTSLDWADARVGTNSTVMVWAENTGDFDVAVSLALSDNLTAGLTLWANESMVSPTYLALGTLTPGQVLEMTLKIVVAGDVPRGDYPFALVFRGDDVV